MFYTRLFVALTLLLSGPVHASASAWFFGGEVEVGLDRPTISTPSEQNITLTQAMANVQQILQSIQQSPTCKRKAAKSLVDSCVTYDHNDPAFTRSTAVELEDFQKLYGIRMSNCELEDAAQSLPSDCKAAISLPPGSIKATSHIKVCLDALYQETNSWTTYLNMKTNALLMCQAMRAEQDKDEQLHFYQVLMSTTSSMSEAIKKYGDSMDELTERFSGLKDGIRDFHTELHRDNREIRAAIKESWTNMQKDMSGVSGDIRGLLQSMGDANQNLHEYTSQINAVLSHAHDLSTQMDARWATGLVKIKDGLEEARNAYQYELERNLGNFHQRVFDITSSMETANSLSSDLLSKLTLLSDDLDIPLEKVGDLAIQVDYVKDAQSAMFTEMEAKVLPILDNLLAAGEHAAFFSTWMSAATGLVRHFVDTFWPTFKAFLIWCPLVFVFVFKGCRKVFGLATGSAVASVVTFALAMSLATSFDLSKIIQAFVNSHPAFFRETPPYFSMLVVFLAGVGMAVLTQDMHRSQRAPAYDPATQLGLLPRFQDDLDLHEQELKQEHSRSS